MKRLLIVSNRLPVSVEVRKGVLSYRPSVGGVATGLSSFYKSHSSVWVGWPGISTDRVQGKEDQVRANLISEFDCYPVFLSQSSIERYYRGYSNRTIWPLFHYFTQHAIYRDSPWNEYIRTNELFCREVESIAQPGDALWIHDYHLMLLPGMLRKKLPHAAIGFFLHIPFPSSEIFRLLPQREDILRGLLGSDLIGFHTHDYVNHFLSSIRRLLGYEHSCGLLVAGEKVLRVDSFPMGIDYEKFTQAGQDPEVKQESEKYHQELGDQIVILSVDRLDYTKGIIQRLEAFSTFLERNPEYLGRVTLMLVAVPSRTQVVTYKALKRHLDELVGRINGEFGTMDWMPIRYIYRSLGFADLTALYSVADACLVTPLRDGMNLIAKEYVACRKDSGGVLILSEMAGAAKELGEAITVNPNNVVEMATSLKVALTMPESEQKHRMKAMQKRLSQYDVVRWAEDFVDRLEDTKRIQESMQAKRLSEVMRRKMLSDYSRSKRSLLLLDYDGTLMPIMDRPEDAEPDHGLLALLAKLAEDEKNEVVVISGRDKSTLGEWLGNLQMGLVSEHGAWIRRKGGQWTAIEPLGGEWKESIKPMLELYVVRTPGSFIEEKDLSLTWHYRKTDPSTGIFRAGELIDNLLGLTSNLGLQVMSGSKVVEIKVSGVSKERAALQWIAQDDWDFILAIGDDRTDEDLFAALPEDAYSVKVGLGASRAKYNLDSPGEVVLLLGEFALARRNTP
jgi:trehalose 6-phosphate synthase/phosphatase